MRSYLLAIAIHALVGSSPPSDPIKSLTWYADRGATISQVLSLDRMAYHLRPKQVKAAISKIQADPNGYISYHLLHALKITSLDEYKRLSSATRIQALISGLKNSVYNNDWGYFYEEGPVYNDSAKALLSYGKEAIPFLAPLLDDRKNVIYFGSAESALVKRLKLRTCDYAYHYINSIQGKPSPYIMDLGIRDKQIRRLKTMFADR